MKILKSPKGQSIPLLSTSTLHLLILCLGLMLSGSIGSSAQSFASITMEDLAHGKAVVAGDNNDGNLYHHKPNINQQDSESSIKDNAMWMFEPAGQENGVNYYYIIDRRHGAALVGGDNYDGNVYHQNPNYRDNAKWQLLPVSGQEGYFYIIDKKHGYALVAGNSYDGYLYHQSANSRSNAKWLLTIVEGHGIKPAPRELLLNQEVIDIKYHVGDKQYVPGGRPDVIIISDTEENRSSVDGTYRFSETETKRTTDTYTITNETSHSLTLKLGTQFGYNSGPNGGFFINASIGIDNEWTTKRGETKSNTIEKTFSFTAEKVHPLPACTKVKYQKKFEGQVATIPFTMHVKRTYGDMSTKVEYVNGKWEGVEFVEGEGNIELAPIPGCGSRD